ncbi:MAG: hypothetical protein ABIO40_08435 [Devosia sp.]
MTDASPPPRTAREFVQDGRRLIVSCDACRHAQFLDSETLTLTFGEDFDVIAHIAEVKAQLYCPACGAGRPDLLLWQPVAGEPAVVHRLTGTKAG